MKVVPLILAGLAAAASAFAQVKTEVVEYRSGDVLLQGVPVL